MGGVVGDLELRVIPLGGLGEIGMNMMVMEYDDTIIVIDSGLMFPEDYMLGIDIVIQDISYLKENRDRVKAIIITHGHEDHVGSLPFVLREINVPIYATRLTLGLIESKLDEFNLTKKVKLNQVRPRESVTVGPFDIEFIRVSHSIADCVSLAITTPVGVVIHTGDFKIDQTPVDGEVIDYAKFSEYGDKGVLALLSDSTNVEKEGYTLSEREVGKSFEEIFARCTGRIIVATFSSNIHRIQQVIDVAARSGRSVIANGRSMINNIDIARRLGYLKVPGGLMVDLSDMKDLAHGEIVLLTTGSQGEPMSALTRMAMNNHKQIKVRKGDTVLLSSKFIPGNEKTISTMINHLYRRGAEVIYEKISEIHVSGHASKEELKIMLNMVRPRFFMPIHGEYRHLVRHKDLAGEVGIPEENRILAENGDVVSITAESAAVTGRVECGKVFVDGKGVGDVSKMVLKDRLHLSKDGIVLAILSINEKTGEVLFGPDIVTRGLFFEEENPHLIDEAREAVLQTLEELNPEAKGEQSEVKEEVRKSLRRYFNKTLSRRPVIVPIVIEI